MPAPLPRAQGPASWERTRSWTAPACLGSPCSQSPCLQCPPPSLCHAYLCLLAGQSSAGPQLCAVPHGVLACSWSKRPQPETDFRLPHFFLRALEAFALQVLGAQGTDCIFLKQRWAHTWGGIGEKRKQQSSLHHGKERPRPEQRGRPRALSHTAALGCAGQRGGRGACGGVRGALPRLPAPQASSQHPAIYSEDLQIVDSLWRLHQGTPMSSSSLGCLGAWGLVGGSQVQASTDPYPCPLAGLLLAGLPAGSCLLAAHLPLPGNPANTLPFPAPSAHNPILSLKFLPPTSVIQPSNGDSKKEMMYNRHRGWAHRRGWGEGWPSPSLVGGC